VYQGPNIFPYQTMASSCIVTFINIYAESDFNREQRTLPYKLDDVLLLIAHHIQSGIYVVHGISASAGAVTVICAMMIPKVDEVLPRLFEVPSKIHFAERKNSETGASEMDKRMPLDSTFVDLNSDFLFRYAHNDCTIDEAIIAVAWQIVDGRYSLNSLMGSLSYFTVVVEGKVDFNKLDFDLFPSPKGPTNVPEDWYLPALPFGQW
jgi:hypothetical protein